MTRPTHRLHSHWRITPTTTLGRASLGLVGAHVALMALSLALVAGGERGGDTLLDKLRLTVPILLAGASAVAAALAALVAVRSRGERAVLVFIPIILGVFVTLFAVGEAPRSPLIMARSPGAAAIRPSCSGS